MFNFIRNKVWDSKNGYIWEMLFFLIYCFREFLREIVRVVKYCLFNGLY